MRGQGADGVSVMVGNLGWKGARGATAEDRIGLSGRANTPQSGGGTGWEGGLEQLFLTVRPAENPGRVWH